jgi:alpha-galactosidase
VHPDTWLYDNHPEWLLMPNEETTKKRQPWMDKVESLLNLGNPEARRWLTEHISSMIEEVGITVYRQDCNFNPLDYWRGADEPDRQGISEIRHIEGLYAFWDELLRRHPGLTIDNCASGGRRIDLETISRSVALWRSDYGSEPEGVQSHTLGINRYVPCSSGGVNSTDPYVSRSNLASGMAICPGDPNASRFDLDELRTRVKEFKLFRPLFYGDFYPLTSHSVESDVWCVYQLYRKEINRGALLAFRRKESPFSAGRFKLRGLAADGKYEFTDIDSGRQRQFTGRELMETGIEVKMPTAPCSVILTYSLISDDK